MLPTWVAWVLAAAVVAGASMPLVAAPGQASTAVSPWGMALRRFRSNRDARVAVVVVIAFCVVAALAPLLSPYPPNAQPDIIGMRGLPPSARNLLGTDLYSRDVFSRILHGARVSLAIGLLAMLLSITVGTLYGAIAGFAGGRIDAVMMRIIDALLSVPRILLLIAITAMWGSLSMGVLIILIGLTGWFGVSRIVRAQVMALATREFVISARALGAPGVRLLMRHILPNVLSPVIVAATLGIGNVIILETGLSYLGLGIRAPQASWGSIIRDGSEQVAAHWWISLFPGLAIVATVMAFNAIGEGLRDALEPR